MTTEVFECIEDGVLPEEMKVAAMEGRLQVQSVIGWIDLEPSDFSDVIGKAGNFYVIKDYNQ